MGRRDGVEGQGFDALEQAQLIRTIRRGLNEPNAYLFLWHTVFEDCKLLIPQERTYLSDQERTHSSEQERTFLSGPFKEEETHLRDSIEETEPRSIERPDPRSKTKRPAADAIAEWPSLDIDVIRRNLQGFRYRQSGQPVEPTDTLIGRLLQVAKFYARTSFELGALLYRKQRELERQPRWWPEKEDWFVKVVDTAYADEWLAAITAPDPISKALEAADPEAKPLPPGKQDEALLETIKSIAALKKFG